MSCWIYVYWIAFGILWIVGGTHEEADEAFCRWFVPTFLGALIIGVGATVIAIGRGAFE